MIQHEDMNVTILLQLVHHFPVAMDQFARTAISLTAEQKACIINQKKRVFECNNELIKEVCWSHAYRRRICSLFLKLVAVLVAALLLWTFVLSKK